MYFKKAHGPFVPSKPELASVFAVGCIRQHINKVMEGRRSAGGVRAVHKQHHVSWGSHHPQGGVANCQWEVTPGAPIAADAVSPSSLNSAALCRCPLRYQQPYMLISALHTAVAPPTLQISWPFWMVLCCHHGCRKTRLGPNEHNRLIQTKTHKTTVALIKF